MKPVPLLFDQPTYVLFLISQNSLQILKALKHITCTMDDVWLKLYIGEASILLPKCTFGVLSCLEGVVKDTCR